jgi:histidine triad (HIT) family protein
MGGRSVGRALFELAKRPLVGRAVGLGFAYGSALLPVRRVLTTDRLIAFYHPRPAWPDHILIVPKRPIRTLLDLAAPVNARHIADILLAAGRIVGDLGLRERGYVLCANGGPRQEVMQIHFHLFTGRRYVRPFDGEPPAASLVADLALAFFPHPRPNWETHLLILPRRPLPPPADLTPADGPALPRLIGPLPDLDGRFHLTARGYTLFIQEHEPVERRLVLHIAAGPQTAE